MRKVPVRLWALLAIFGATLLWNCRGKEGPQGPQGPQGPAGQNLTRIREGYIRGTVKGRDLTRNQDFQLSFDYTYLPVWFGYPGGWEPEAGQPDTVSIYLAREGERGGSFNINLYYQRSTNMAWIDYLNADILDISGNAASGYNTSYYSSFPTDTAYVTGFSFRGDTLVTGRLTYVKRSKTPADTLVAEFSSRVLRVVYYQRQGQPFSSVSQTHFE